MPLSFHQAMAELSEEVGVELGFRVGIHLGEVVLIETPPEDVARGAKPLEVEGLAKPTAARLMSVAQGRQTLLSQAAFDVARRAAVGSEMGDGTLAWLAHGDYMLKGITRPTPIFEVGVEGFAPLGRAPDTEKVRRVLEQDTLPGWRPAPGMDIPNRGNWVIQRKLGEGGFGEVWLVAHRKTGDRRVYKFCFERRLLRMLQREITIFRVLKETLGERDDISRIVDWNFDQEPFYIESEYTAGGDLLVWAEEQGGIGEVPLDTRIEIVAQAAEALGAAHSVGVLHKDVKPANLLVRPVATGPPRIRLTDFGIGLLTDERHLVESGITVLGLTEMATPDLSTTAGTRLYQPPRWLLANPRRCRRMSMPSGSCSTRAWRVTLREPWPPAGNATSTTRICGRTSPGRSTAPRSAGWPTRVGSPNGSAASTTDVVSAPKPSASKPRPKPSGWPPRGSGNGCAGEGLPSPSCSWCPSACWYSNGAVRGRRSAPTGRPRPPARSPSSW